MNKVFICFNVRNSEGIVGFGPVFTKEIDAQLWVKKERLRGNTEATYDSVEFNPKVHCCETCTQMRLCGGTCIDMTCYIGFNGGDHDGWTDEKKNQELRNKNEVNDNDYQYTLADTINR